MRLGGDLDLVRAAFLGDEGGLENAPAPFQERKLQPLDPPARGGDFAGDGSLVNRKTGFVQHGALEEDGVAGLRGFRAVTQADAVLPGKVALMGHPADNLAQKR